MSDYENFFSNKSDDNVLKKYFYLLVNDRKISEENAWTILSNIVTGLVNNTESIEDVLCAFKNEYDAQVKLEDDKRKEEALKFKSNLNSETLDKVKNLWKGLN